MTGNENENLSENIEQYILNLFENEQENFIKMRRKEIAKIFDCVPSQINYVLRSRFTPENGYLIESRRGEYGYIKILKIHCQNPDEKVSHIEDLIEDEITLRDANKLLKSLQQRNFITSRERLLAEIALRNIAEVVPENYCNEMLALLLKKMLGGLMLA